MQVLPTIKGQTWSCTDFLKAIRDAFTTEEECMAVRMYFYGATQSGWNEIRPFAKKWVRQKTGRSIKAYIGTDHALTEPAALDAMQKDGVLVYILTCYVGTFHPKLIVFSGDKQTLLLSGSNNLTRKALSSNIEFATSIVIPAKFDQFDRWETAIHESSDILTNELLKDYEQQRNRRQKKLQDSDVSWQFTWRKRRTPTPRPSAIKGRKSADLLTSGALLYEVMPKETGPGGSQIQILKKVATDFFGLPDRVGSQIFITLTNATSGEVRKLTMTFNSNTTMRLSIHEASFTARPCFLVFYRKSPSAFRFEVVSEADEPVLFEELDALLGQRSGKQRRFLAIK